VALAEVAVQQPGVVGKAKFNNSSLQAYNNLCEREKECLQAYNNKKESFYGAYLPSLPKSYWPMYPI